jgi:tRNA-guanine transglycosylase
VEDTKAPIILANTYHLYLRPGTETLQTLGGLHEFMKWPKPILTDSGGFQVFSLGKQMEAKQQIKPTNHDETKIPNVQTFSMTKIGDEGVAFTSYLDGTKHFFTPEKAIEIQRAIGADIIMAFDECTPDNATPAYAQEALDRTHRWAAQCVNYWEEKNRLSHYNHYQALFGIIQGAMHQDLRVASTKAITALPFDGIAGVMDWIEKLLPADKPRYAMGLGRDPQNLIDAVLAGFDMFDCVAPTRLARNGAVYVGEIDFSAEPWRFVSEYDNGRLNIGNEKFTRDEKVIQPGCDCTTCQAGYSRAYLRHLFKTQELAYYRLASIHNVRFMIRITEQLREAILR